MRRAFVAVAVMLLLNLNPNAVLGCSCVPFTKTQLVDNASVIFTGTVTGRSWLYGLTTGCAAGGTETVTLTFAVESVFKGDPPRTVTVSTSANGASCGYGFVDGRLYTVFATGSGDRLETNLCRGNVEGAIVAAEYGLGGARPPKERRAARPTAAGRPACPRADRCARA